MHEEIGKPSGKDNNPSLENIIMGRRMERAVAIARLKIMAGNLLELFIPLSGAPLPSRLDYGILDYNFSYQYNSIEE